MYLLKLSQITALLTAILSASAIPTDSDTTPSFETNDGSHVNLAKRWNITYDATRPRPDLTHHEKRDTWYGWYECSKPDFKGDCHWQRILPGERKCYNANKGLTGSFGPDPGVLCNIYDNYDCPMINKKPDGDWIPGFKFPGVSECANDQSFRDAGMWDCPGSWVCDITDTNWL